MNGWERILHFFEGKPVDHVPVMPITMMFAGDRIGVPYREYATDYRVLAEAQVHTARQFDFDYVSAISDPAREAADLGATIEYYDDQPPALVEEHARLADKGDLARLDFPDPLGGGRMHDRVRGLALLKEKIGAEKLVEGWVEGPCAEAADLRGINTLMLDFFDDPTFVRDLFEFVVENALRFAAPQVEAGADLIGVGDAAASLIGPALYRDFVFPYERKLIDGLHQLGTRVRLHICGNTNKLLPWMGRLGADMIDLDWMVPFDRARAHTSPAQVLAGNIDPVAALRDGTPATIGEALARCHRQCGPRYIVAAGCEVVRDTPEENVRALVDYGKCHQPEL